MAARPTTLARCAALVVGLPVLLPGASGCLRATWPAETQRIDQGCVDAECVCTPRACGAGDCGSILDGCGGNVECGGCAGVETCGGAGTPNRCEVGPDVVRLSACQTVSDSAVYLLDGDVAGTGTDDCFVFANAANVVFDGGGHTIRAAGVAIRIVAPSISVIVRNARVDGDVAIDGPTAPGCDDAVRDLRLERLTMRSGEVDAQGAVCGLSLVENEIDGFIGVTSAWFVHDGFDIRDNTFGGVWLYNVGGVTFTGNTVTGPLSLDALDGPSQGNTFRDNVVLAAATSDHTVYLRTVVASSFIDNVVRSLGAEPVTVLRLDGVRDSVFRGNDFEAVNHAADTAVIAQGFGCTDDVFEGNRIVATQPGSRGVFSHFASACCDADGAGDPSGVCAAPFDQPCWAQRNRWVGNTIIASGDGIYHYAEGGEQVYVNNVIVGNPAVAVDGCEASGILYLSNTFSGGDRGALLGPSSCPVEARNNIFHSTGTRAVDSGPSLSGDYNLFFPGPAPIDQVHAVLADPRFVLSAATPASAATYHLLADSPALDAGDPAAAGYGPWSMEDVDGDARPSGLGFDIGADEIR